MTGTITILIYNVTEVLYSNKDMVYILKHM